MATSGFSSDGVPVGASLSVSDVFTVVAVVVVVGGGVSTSAGGWSSE